MNELERFRHIKTFIFDVDGVLTNSDLIVLENGRLLRKMNTRDGYAIKRAVQKGYHVCIITGGKSSGVELRLRNLGVQDVYKGVQDKVEKYKYHIHAYELNPEHILYMGDDMPDYDVMRLVGFPCCPNDAAPEILNICQYVSPAKGGAGCVRDVIEKVLKLNNDWFDEAEKPEIELEINLPEE